jgi:threonine/homoserine/homoserine lactone efflux protein
VLPTTNNLLLFLSAGILLNLTPGPDMTYVITRSIAEGRRAGIVSSLGIATGTLVHTTLVALGLASLLAAVPVAFEIVKYAGAAYLIFIGVQLLRSRDEAFAAAAIEPARLRAIYRQGVITNVLNPKVAIFFIAFLPQFVSPERGLVVAQIVTLALLFNTTGTVVNVAVAVLASRMGTALRGRIGSGAALRRASGAVFVGLGVRLAFVGRR